MGNFLKSIIDRARQGEELTLSNIDEQAIVMVNPEGATIVDVEQTSEIVLLHTNSVESEITFNLSKGVKLYLTDIYIGQSKQMLNVDICQDAACNITSFDLAGAEVVYNISLNETGGDAELNILQLTGGTDISKSNAIIRHISSDCTSRSLAKCVAAGESRAEFHGLVYVAEGAQRTSSEQNSRNIQLSDKAHIIAQPQLEIYADDVKCTHGATVGQMNDDAIFYMMQRGLSRASAQKLHLEGFVDDIVNHCSIPYLANELKAMVEARLHQI